MKRGNGIGYKTNKNQKKEKRQSFKTQYFSFLFSKSTKYTKVYFQNADNGYDDGDETKKKKKNRAEISIFYLEYLPMQKKSFFFAENCSQTIYFLFIIRGKKKAQKNATYFFLGYN